MKTATPAQNPLALYVGRVSLFEPVDWLIYSGWVGMMFGLFAVQLGFLLAGSHSGVSFPGFAWCVPVGTFIFACAIAVDTIGHRTVYKEEIKKGEAFVHHLTMFAGIASCILLCVGYNYPDAVRYPALALIILSVIYSLIDEFMHWRRYLSQKSDVVEMWSHFFILLGHTTMMLSWWRWFDSGYVGVSATLSALKNL